MSARTTTTLVATLLAAVMAVSVSYAASGPSGPATVKTRSTSLGTIVVDAKGRTLYLFEKDRAGKSACSGGCAADWPPLLTKGKPKAAGSARKAKLGTIRRSNGTTLVSYGGHPLYTYVGDSGPGQTTGEGLDQFGAEWYVLGANGGKIEKSGS